MNIRVIVAIAVIIGLLEVVFIANPDLWDDLVYKAAKVPEWFRAHNSWLAQPKPPKN
jgi:hypothetical protein